MVEHLRGAFRPDECARWVAGVYAARRHWTPNFDGLQFTLGRAWYTHLEEDRREDYFAAAADSDALVEHFVPGLQARMLQLLSRSVGEEVVPRHGWCGPGVHIFPAGGWLAGRGGDIHFDTEGLQAHELALRVPARSAIVMLQPPERGGGLTIWDRLYDGEDEVTEAPPGGTTIEYSVGDAVVFDSYRLHQIQPFAGAVDRISATAHLVFSLGRWRSWF